MNKLIILFIFSLTLVSCTHNNGEIGPLFGSWKLTSIDIDGNKDDSYQGAAFFAFQNDAFGVNTPSSHDGFWIIGKWVCTGNKLSITYDNNVFEPIRSLYFQSGTTTYDIISLDSKNLIFSGMVDGKLIKYTLIKW